MKTAKFLCALLAALILIGMCACGDAKGGSETAAPEATVTAAAEETTDDGRDENGFIRDTLPEDLKYDGKTVRILYWDDVENQEYFATEQTGADVNDAIFARNAMVETRLGISLEYTGTPGDSGNAKVYLASMEANIKAGDNAYDIISAHSRTVGLCAYNGITQDLSKLEYMNFDMPWWPGSLTETASINGQLHFVSGDISTNMLYMMYVVFYNKDYIKNYSQLSDPYEYVENGTWTLDKMIEMSTGLYEDLDAVSGKSQGDRYGQAARTLHIDPYLWGSGILGIENKDGTLVLSESFTGDKTTSLIEKLNNYLVNSADNVLYTESNTTIPIFLDGRSFFITDRADIAIFDLGDKTFEMGILPMPKYDTDQENYSTVMGNPFSLYAVPVNAPDAEMSGAVLECLASESYRRITPVIFELSMKTRYASGGNDAICYDLSRNGAVYDLSRIFWKVLSDYAKAPDTLFQNQVLAGASGWSSQLKSNKKLLEKAINEINKVFAD